MLVGNKCDKNMEREVSREEGYQMAKRIKADFVEASARTCINVEKAFYQVVRMIRSTKAGNVSSLSIERKSKKCIIL